LELIARIRTRVIQALNRPVEVVSCYEAGYDEFWLRRLLEAHGVRNYVIDPASVQVVRRARRVKTDNVDVGKLLRSLMAYLRGVSRRCGALCACQVLPKKMTVGCIASVIA
jgi:transposase